MKPVPDSQPNQRSVPTVSGAKAATARGQGPGTDKVVDFLTSSPRRWWLFGLFLVVATILAYQPIWHAGFIWDDDQHLTANPCIVGPLGFKQIWTSSAAVYYPLVLTSFWVQHALWGLNPIPYHLVDIAMHAACGILLWRVLQSLKARGAWLGAALWALHPVQTESAAWITELKNTQSGFFYLLTILLFLKWRSEETPTQQQKAERYYILSLFCAASAILSKTSTVMLPVVLGLCWWWMDGRWQWRNIFRLVPFFAISAVASGWTIWEQKYHSHALGPEWAQSWPQRFAIAGKDIWFYLGKLFWPHPLIFLYPRWQINASQPLVYLPVLAAGIIGLVLWLKRRSALKPLFFAYAYFVVSLFPILGFFNVYFFRYSFVADHFQYLASMGPLALAGAGISVGFNYFKEGSLFLKPAVCGILLVTLGTLLLMLGVLTWRQCGMYADSETLWRVTLAKNPDCWMAHNNLGFVLVQKGEVDEAMAQFQKAVQINPKDPPSWNNVGNVLLQMGKVDEAIPYFQKALQVDPNYTEALNNLGSALLQEGEVDEAMAQFQKALQINPNSAEAHGNLGNVMLQEGKVDEAIAHYQKALQISPHNPNLYNNLGNALSRQGQFEQAIAHYQAAIKLEPNNPAFLNNLAWLLATCSEARVRNGQQAVELAERACQLTDYEKPQLICTLAVAYAEAGRFEDAVAASEKTHDLALALGQQALALKSQELVQLFKARRPYREQIVQ